MKIFLVQRATINSHRDDKKTLSQSVMFDYMESSEFEWGALPQSLQRLEEKPGKMGKVFWQKNNRFLYIYNNLGGKYNEYVNLLHELWSNKIRTKERSEFCPQLGLCKSNTNFWWDIENDVMWSFDQYYMLSLPKYLQNSWNFMNKPKPKS